MRNTVQLLLLLMVMLLFGSRNAAAGDSVGGVNVALLNTACDVQYMTAEEKAVIWEMNKVRTNPKWYAETYVKPYMTYYNDKLLKLPQLPYNIKTVEGVAAVRELYDYLLKAPPLGALYPDIALKNAAAWLAADQEKGNLIGHTGSDGSTPLMRVECFGKFSGMTGENIEYGFDDAFNIVMALLIDDNVPDRGHRLNIMQQRYHLAGVGIGKHQEYRAVCVIEYAEKEDDSR